MKITITSLKELGFEDQTGGWGGSFGANWIYRLRRGNIDLEIRQVDYDLHWHLTSDFSVAFKVMNDLNEFCLKKFGEKIYEEKINKL